MKEKVIHTTIGVYPNGDVMINGVDEKNLEEHVAYNKKFRPGRALLVDGECVYKGNADDDTIATAQHTYRHTKCQFDTAPYR